MEKKGKALCCPGCGKHCPVNAPSCAYGRRHCGSHSAVLSNKSARNHKPGLPGRLQPAGQPCKRK